MDSKVSGHFQNILDYIKLFIIFCLSFLFFIMFHWLNLNIQALFGERVHLQGKMAESTRPSSG